MKKKRVAFMRSCHPLFYWPVLWMGTFTLAKSQPLDRLSLLEPRNIMSLFSSEDIASMSLYLTNKQTFELWRLLDETCIQSHTRRPLGASVSFRLVAEFEIKRGSWRRSSPKVMQPFVSQRTGRGTPVVLRISGKRCKQPPAAVGIDSPHSTWVRCHGLYTSLHLIRC